MKPLIVILVSLGCCVSAAVGDELIKLTGMKDAAVLRAVEPVNLRHVEELNRLLETMSASGDLEGALKVKEELAAVRDSPAGISSAEKSTYQRLEILRERRADDLERALGPINSTYVSELKKLQRQLTTAGDLEKAQEVRKELELFQINSAISGGDISIDELQVHHLEGTSWELKNVGGTEVLKFEQGRFQVFKPDGIGGLRAGDYRNWQIEDPKRRQIRIFYHYGEEVATINSKFTEMKDTKHVLKRIVD